MRLYPMRRLLVAAAMVVGGLVPVAVAQTPDGGAGDPAAWTFDPPRLLWVGVTDAVAHGPGPVVAHVVHIRPGAPVYLEPVVSNDLLGQGKETVSSMCGRRTAAACVNANYPICFVCVSPHGAVVIDRELLVSPVWHQWQVWTRDGRLTSEAWETRSYLEVASSDEPQELTIDAVNAAPRPDRLVLLNSHWGTSTGAPEGAYEVVFGGGEPLTVGGVRQRATLRGVNVTGDTPIPPDGFVLSGMGSGADALWAYVDAYWPESLNLVVSSPAEVTTAISGHPRLIDQGVRQTLDPADGKVTKRHPRTVIGWNPDGDVWLVVIDGRQESSIGLDLWDTTDFMEMLGATDAVNLDGGGSSTLAVWCGVDAGWCAQNSPSDGGERLVSTALAVVPLDR